MLRRNRVGEDGFYQVRRGARSRLRDWFRRHPVITILIGMAALGGITWWEAARIEGARYTVAHGWGTGLATGILASAGLTAIWAAALAATRGRPRLRAQFQWPLAVVLGISWYLCFRFTMPPNSSSAGPYVITTGIEVGEIAYTATYTAWFLALTLWLLWRRLAVLIPGRIR